MVVAGGPALGPSYLTLVRQPMALGREGARLFRRQRVLWEDHPIGRTCSDCLPPSYVGFGVCDRHGLCGQYTLICSIACFCERCDIKRLILTGP